MAPGNLSVAGPGVKSMVATPTDSFRTPHSSETDLIGYTLVLDQAAWMGAWRRSGRPTPGPGRIRPQLDMKEQNAMCDSNSPPTDVFEMGLPPHWRDSGVRDVLGHAVAVIALLRLLFSDEQFAGIDLKALRREPTRQVGPHLRQAEHDVIWSAPVVVPEGADPQRVYFLIEVQSSVAANMALRMMIYVALQGLQLERDYEVPLPPLVPIVLYTEEDPWDASEDPGEMFSVWFPESLPRLRYYVLDLCRVEAEARSGNVMALLAMVVRGANEEELLRGAKALYRRLVELGDTPMEDSFFELVRWMCKNKWPDRRWEDCGNMAELVDALEKRTITWPEKWKANYIAEGRVGMLVSMARQRFGEAVASTMSALLGSVRTESALDRVGTWLLTCETGDDLIAKIRQM